MNAYTPGIERMMKRLFDSLREKDRRRYAAVEATKLGHGGVEYIAACWGAIPRPFARDRRNWKSGTTWTPDVSEKKGRPQTVDRHLPDPRGELPGGASRPHRRRSDASRRQVDEPDAAGDRHADSTAMGTPVSRNIVSSAAPQARIPQAESSEEQDDGPRNPDRNAQFENIAGLKADYHDAGMTRSSAWTRRKRRFWAISPASGRVRARAWSRRSTMIFAAAAAGVVIPHGLYDVKRNLGHVTLGFGHDTSELACDSLELWWRRHGPSSLPAGQVDLALVRRRRKQQCQASYLSRKTSRRLVNRIHLPIRVAHYPSYCSKYNPIEHRFFPHLTLACRGVIFHTLETVRYYTPCGAE